MTKLAFVDTETTGLDPDRHEIWEVGLVLRDPTVEVGDEGYEAEWVWQLPVDLGQADPMALKIGRFRERYEITDKELDEPFFKKDKVLKGFAREFARLTHEAHLVGNVVSFDEERLRRLLRKYGQCPTWHYHLVDCEALAAGHLGESPPWNSRDLSEAIGVEMPSDEDRHTALGDARWARDMFDAVVDREGTV